MFFCLFIICMFIEENQHAWKLASNVYDLCKYDNSLKRYIGAINVKHKTSDFFQFKLIYNKFVIITLMYNSETTTEDQNHGLARWQSSYWENGKGDMKFFLHFKAVTPFFLSQRLLCFNEDLAAELFSSDCFLLRWSPWISHWIWALCQQTWQMSWKK